MEAEVLISEAIDGENGSFSHGLGKLDSGIGLFPTTHDKHAGDNNPWPDDTLPSPKRGY